MKTRYFALAVGIVFLLAGIAGFIPGITTAPHPDEPPLALEAMRGRVLGLLPVNVLHNLIHLGFGIWGVVAYRSFANARLYARSVAIIYGVLVIAGLIPGLRTVFGLVPIYGPDVIFHLLLAAIAAYFGWAIAPREAPRPA